MSREISRRSGFVAAALLVASLVSGCSSVPSSGPSRDAVMDVGAQANAPYLIVPISDGAIENLEHFPGPSLRGRFGDYRGPVVQRIGIGDSVAVTIYEAASGGLFSQSLSADASGSHSAQLPPQVVQRDGSITVPYAGRVKVAGRTTPEVEAMIVARLTGKAIQPQVVVTLSLNVATSVTITGEAVRGARVPLTARGDRLLDIIADAGGILVPASQSFIELTRGGRTVRVPYQRLIDDPREDIYARPGDTLTVVRYPLTFTAVGATLQNAVVPFDARGISLEEAIGKAAGFIDERADPAGVFVFRDEPVEAARAYAGLTAAQASRGRVPTVYVINMREPNSLFLARRFAIHDKDLVYVSNSPFSDVEKVMGLMQTVAAPAGAGLAAYATIRSASAADNGALGYLAASSASPATVIR